MVTANELRIGNLVFEIHDTPKGQRKDVFKVAAINSLTGTLINEDDNITQVDYCEPIPIARDVLEKAGFHRMHSNNLYIDLDDNHLIFYDTLQGSLEVQSEEALTREGSLKLNIKYMHQLQNIYFALTGEELPINIPSPSLSFGFGTKTVLEREKQS